MKIVGELNLGFSDAQNYTQRGNKQILSKVFVRNKYLDELIKSNIYFLIGEKGTGKTAYAVYLSNCEYKNNKSVLKFISGTDYEKFYELKKSGKIDISGYVDIWKTIIYLLLAKSIKNNDRVLNFFDRSNLPQIVEAIDEYYHRAFSPEIINAMKIVDNSELAARLMFKHAEGKGGVSQQVEFTEQQLQMNLYYICKQFQDCLGSLKLKKNLTLYIDGIDVRPEQIPYTDYLACIKGLANAVWTLNTEVFANVRDSQGQFKVVLLLRPDIFVSLGLQNKSNKLRDNSVYLDWKTTYVDYERSYLYEMANKLLCSEQEYDAHIWKKYFPWKLPSSKPEKREYDTAFIEFLKISLSRPRDIQTILDLIQKIMIENRLDNQNFFDLSSFQSDRFQNQYSEYFLSSLQDQLSYYYSEEDFKYFNKFFEYFKDSKFSYMQYEESYLKFIDYILNNAEDIPKFMEDSKDFLQLLYDSNVIVAIEEGPYYHYSYREKSLTNISPDVPYGEGINYRFHYGLYKKGQFGRYN